MRDDVVVMARKPEPGRVKTRLAATLGGAAACDLYRAFLRDLHARLKGGAWRLVWAVTPAGTGLTDDLGEEVEAIDQRGEDLGARMRNGFADLFAAGADRVVMLGADVPHASPDTVAAALDALARCDVVLQPTRDGGYCLIGLRHPHELFAGIPMGTSEVLRLTLERAAALELSVELLPETFDVDEKTDLIQLAALIASGALDLPETAQALRRHALAGVSS